jgi:integrase/recombinase XerC
VTKDQMMPKYEAGERTCPICGEPLPAHQTWIGAKFRLCGKPECVAVVKAKPRARYIGATERRCDGEGCENFVPEGRYATRPPYLSCSAECWYRRFLKGNLVRQCGCGCGREVLRPCDRKTATGLVFASSKHQRSYLINKYLTDHCGKFRDTVDEYLNGFATLHYRDPKSVRS